MYTKTYSATLQGINAKVVGVELDASTGLPGFTIVGLVSKSINEAKERVSVALRSADFELAPKKILANLNPANIKKEGPHFDLSIATALMVNFGHIDVEPDFLSQFCFLGELSLQADVRKVRGALPLSLELASNGIKYLVIPKANQDEVSLINLSKSAQKTTIFSVENLKDVKELIEALDKNKEDIYNKFLVPTVDLEQIRQKYSPSRRARNNKEDFDKIIGQHKAKRGLEIAAAGRHHVLMIGPPGCGKSMLAKSFPTLLPELELDEALEVTKIYSVTGNSQSDIIFSPPFRQPHHSSTSVALIGGGVPIRPGEITMAHQGVLFMDEFPEFNKYTIEQLREILENKEITLNKGHQSFTYPADFILVVACNPSPCGHHRDKDRPSRSTPAQIQRYLSKLSGPILDRIDIHLELEKLSKDEISLLSDQEHILEDKAANDKLASIKANITKARDFARNTAQELQLNKETKEFMDHAVFNLNISARSHNKVVKIARTIANLDEQETISIDHLAEAFQFRAVDWDKYFV